MSAASQRRSPLAGVILFTKENHPRTPKRTQGAGRPLTLVPFSLNHPSGKHVRATARQSRVSIGFRLGLRLYPLSRWCSAVSFPSATCLRRCRSCTSGTKTHVSSVRNLTAERQRPQEARQIESRAQLSMHSSAQRVQHRHSRDRKWQVKGAALAVLGVPKGAILPLRMAPFAGRQRASALLICRAALGTPRAAPRKAGSLSKETIPCEPSEGVSPFDLPCRPRHSPRGSAQSGFSFAKRPSLAGRQRASALLICRAALGTLL